MPLNISPPSADLLATYARALKDLTGNHCDETKVFHIPSGILYEEDLLSGAGLEAVVPSGCRVLYLGAWEGGEPGYTICEMPDATSDRSSEIRSFTQGPFAHLVNQRIGEAGRLKQLLAAHFQLRFLSMPAMQLQAVHLAFKGRVEDLIPSNLAADPLLKPALSKAQQILDQPEVQKAVSFLAQAALEDLILPVASGDPRLSPMAILRASEFLRIARQIATERASRTRSALSS